MCKDNEEGKKVPAIKDRPQAKAAQNIRKIVQKNMKAKGLKFNDIFPEHKNKNEK